MNSSEFDFDLFLPCCSIHPFLVHAATAGGYIPKRIYSNPIHLAIRRNLMRPLNDIRFDYRLNPNIEEIFSEKRRIFGEGNYEFDRTAYLADFIEYAKRGCFSFDRTNIHDSKSSLYHLVAYPILNRNTISSYFRMINEVIPSREWLLLNCPLSGISMPPEIHSPFDARALLYSLRNAKLGVGLF